MSTRDGEPHERSFSGRAYRLTCAEDRPYVTLATPEGAPMLELFVPSGVDTTRGQDDTTGVDAFVGERSDDGAVFTLTASSSIWRRKTYRIVCERERLRFEVEVEGEGTLTDVHYFGGAYSGQTRWGSGAFWSGTRLGRGFTPEPSVDEDPYFAPGCGAVIDATGVPLPGKGDWFFTPPPYCYAFETLDGWLTFGVEADAGANGYTDYRYEAQRGAFRLALTFDGATHVRGRTRLPSIGIEFARDPYDALAAHTATLRRRGVVPDVAAAARPAWWDGPIFCGWGSQCHVAKTSGGRPQDHATEAHYRRFLATLDDAGVAPRVVVLDDKWQSTYGDNGVDERKWPRLRAFVDEQHEADRRVLLWLKAWDPEGLPADECVRNAAGTPIACDPTSPAFERRARAGVRRMLSAEGDDADGFKLDFTARMPSGPGLTRHGEPWGLELMKRYLHILHSEAKAVKPDALLMTHTPHPYLADVLDMIRLNDINAGSDVNLAMRHRARVAAAACPSAMIDTDNWPMPDRASWRRYVGLQRELGVPSLYYSSHIDSTGEPLLREDYALIRTAWAEEAR